MTTPLFIDHVKIRLEPELRQALTDRARSEKTTVSEMLRRELRTLVRQGQAPEGRS
ncbi:hypothetical protein MBUL_04444 (plasmid) [Methylobacterium bullatum]|uniref:Uncharacterized protein n=1 Tax=Methylobacterium bullatum TaxID=570505 RepID=A0A679JIY0_9HYPH|nr:hypothetical protein MBUL_04444 [Methylobacterium bullatum]